MTLGSRSERGTLRPISATSTAAGANYQVSRPSTARPTSRNGKRGIIARGSLAPKLRDFALQAERMAADLVSPDESLEELRRSLMQIQQDCNSIILEANAKEAQLLEVNNEIHLLENNTRERQQSEERAAVMEQLNEAEEQVFSAMETRQVYQHMVERLTKELRIVQEKVKVMEEHLARKTREVQERKTASSLLHQETVDATDKLETLNQELEHERGICSEVAAGIETSLQERHTKLRQREAFEDWRYEVAKDAATEAFQAIAGRYQKLYAIEKLTGNYLQQVTFLQSEQSRATEDGFQKIREVTGLSDVMQIVHSFLNKDVDADRLIASIRAAEARLQRLQEQHARQKREEEQILSRDDAVASSRETSLQYLPAVVASTRADLDQARRGSEELRRQLKAITLLLDRILDWAKHISTLFPKLPGIYEKVTHETDLLPFFLSLAKAVNSFLEEVSSHPDFPRVALESNRRLQADQARMLSDYEFWRSNCRTRPAKRDSVVDVDAKGSKASNKADDYDLQVSDFLYERERIKAESSLPLAIRQGGGKQDRHKGRRGSTSLGKARLRSE